MPARPKKPERHIIARIPGQTGKIVIEPSQYDIYREPDKIKVHARLVPGPARPLVDFDILNRGIDAKLEEARRFMGGFPQIPGVKRTSKSLFRHPIKLKLVGGGWAEGWTIFHPLRWLGKIFLKQKGEFNKKTGKWEQPGLLASRKEGARRAKAAAWRNESGVEMRMQEAHQRLENSMRAAAGELRQKVETGAVRPDNRGEHIAIYNDAVSKAWLRFQGEITGILKRFRGDYKVDDRPVIGAIDKGIIPKRSGYIR